MLAFIRRAVVTVLIAQWLCAEAALWAPGIAPAIESLTATVRIPTHDKWSDLLTGFEEARREFVSRSGGSETDGAAERLGFLRNTGFFADR